ncbi:cytochrome P450 [Streptomyces sp. NBC_01233]|uniref:cytochrome P450 n=1 Tax=Streptomyces sp. NBC_01233 TaxID=2903787 RepID=UPI002E1571CF|nr:cytochrome P450 [Streptomyces sp. NBC_01233]
MMRSPDRFLASLPEHGDLVQIMLGTRPTYAVCHPDLAEKVLLNADHAFDKGGPLFDSLGEFLGDGLVTCPNAKHTRQRRLVQPAFHRSRMAAYSELAAAQAATMADSWRGGQVIDTLHDMQQLSMQILVNTMFAGWAAEGPASEERVLAAVETLVQSAFLRTVAPALSRLPIPVNRRFDQAKRELHARIDSTVRAYRAGETDHGDLLSILVSRDDKGDGLSDEEIRDQAITFFIAGIGTTAATLCWTLYFLSRDAELDAEVAAEVRKIRPEGPIGYEDVPEFALLRRTITESLRIRPASWMYTRVAVADTELAGHHLPTGAAMLISPYLLQNRSDLVHDPDRFDVGRWADEDDSRFRGIAMFPFGAGARKCIGDEFAVNNLVLTLATMLRRWRLEPLTMAPVGARASGMLEPRNLRLRLRERGQA